MALDGSGLHLMTVMHALGSSSNPIPPDRRTTWTTRMVMDRWGIFKRTRWSCCKIRGFTLLELLLVVLILGILGLAVSPSLMSVVSEERLKAGAGQLADALAYARVLAVEHERPFGVKIDVDGNRFRVFRVLEDGSEETVLHPLAKDQYTRDFDESATASGVEMTVGPAGGGILFYPGGHTSFDTDQTISLSSGRYSLDVVIRAGTGRIVIQ